MSELTPLYDEARSQLLRRLYQLTDRVEQIEQDLRHRPNADSEERAVELENDQVLEQLDESSLAEARRIREALERIDDGTYGTCVRCGGAIESNRLRAIPSATRCLTCATT